jgi:hypothetical protein
MVLTVLAVACIEIFKLYIHRLIQHTGPLLALVLCRSPLTCKNKILNYLVHKV